MSTRLQALLVEDSSADAELLIAALAREGFSLRHERVQTARDLQAALATRQWDVVLCDYVMPGFSAPEAIRIVRKHSAELPMIVISGTIGEEQAVEAIKLGATDYLLKDRLAGLGLAIRRAILERQHNSVHAAAKMALLRSEENLAQAQSIAHIGSWELELVNPADLNANPLRWSDELFRILGRQPGEIDVSFENFFRSVHPDDRERIRDAIRETVRTGRPSRLDHRILLPDGAERVVQQQATLLRDPQGKPRRLMGTTQDVTEQWQTAQALRASEARYHTLFEYAPDGIVIDDGTGQYLDANASACRLFGYARQEFLTLYARDLVVPSESPQLPRAIEAIKSGLPYHHEWHFRRKDGSIFLGDVIAAVMPGGSMMGMIRDITERRQTEEALQSQLAELRRWQAMTLGREEHIIGLKREINDLLVRLGQPPRYTSPNAAL